MIDRERKVDLAVLSEDQISSLETKLSDKLLKILENAGIEANKILNVYGLEVQIAYSLKDKREIEKKS